MALDSTEERKVGKLAGSDDTLGRQAGGFGRHGRWTGRQADKQAGLESGLAGWLVAGWSERGRSRVGARELSS